MPRHGNPKELTINLTAEDDRHAPRDRPTSSPIALEGVDLSSIDGGIGQKSLSSLPSLPASPLASSPSLRKTSASKSILSPFKSRSREASRERSRERARQLQLQQQQKQQYQEQKKLIHQEHRMQEQEGRLPESGSMSKIYHLRQAPGSTPELSLVSSAESVAKGHDEGMSARHLHMQHNGPGKVREHAVGAPGRCAACDLYGEHVIAGTHFITSPLALLHASNISDASNTTANHSVVLNRRDLPTLYIAQSVYHSQRLDVLTILPRNRSTRYQAPAFTSSQRRQHSNQEEGQVISQSPHTITLNTKRVPVESKKTKWPLSATSRTTSQLGATLSGLASSRNGELQLQNQGQGSARQVSRPRSLRRK